MPKELILNFSRSVPSLEACDFPRGFQLCTIVGIVFACYLCQLYYDSRRNQKMQIDGVVLEPFRAPDCNLSSQWIFGNKYTPSCNRCGIFHCTFFTCDIAELPRLIRYLHIVMETSLLDTTMVINDYSSAIELVSFGGWRFITD